ncbi:MAG: 1-deoxy-D-xylulose-5-phosphate synthase [Verrucomicrobiota bacterium]|nr:1-deoxy-D-xylulose-5-phosphate synthase [Verrucomicrobiota bacterium]
MPILKTISSPSDVKALPEGKLPQLAEEIRQRIISVTAHNGGHIGPNLGVVELTLALHRVFDTPADKFIFDVAHQGYVHKLLTGRNGPEFDKIRQSGGLSGFLTQTESVHDCYGAGHAGTALSAALGMAVARDLKGTKEHVVAICGDAALTCGITMEAINNISVSTKRLIVILNDNEWSIAKNVGAIATYLNELITSPRYNKIDHDLKSFIEKLPGGQNLVEYGRRWKRETKDFIVQSSLFESYGLRYIGPIDGHDIGGLTRYLEFAKAAEKPILLHVLTTKGKGYAAALSQPEKFHGAPPFDIETGLSQSTKKDAPANYQDVMGTQLTRFARADKRIVGITAAMSPGTGLNILKDNLPGQFFDVGIAEEHAVLFAAGLAVQGIKPVVAIYSTFLQRGYDPIIHDIALQNLPCVFCMDRAGLSPSDGPTHHGLFDIAFLRPVPGVIVMQPKDEDELTDMLWTALHTPQPTFIRYPRGAGTGKPIKETPELLPIGKAEVLRNGVEIQIWALGQWLQEAMQLADALTLELGVTVGVVNARFAKPLDIELLAQQARSARLLVTMEDHVITGGFGSAVLEALQDAAIQRPVIRIGWPDRFIEHGTTVAALRMANGLDFDSIKDRIVQQWKQIVTVV